LKQSQLDPPKPQGVSMDAIFAPEPDDDEERKQDLEDAKNKFIKNKYKATQLLNKPLSELQSKAKEYGIADGIVDTIITNIQKLKQGTDSLFGEIPSVLDISFLFVFLLSSFFF
jgi:5-bromo-4-chloroindolyl phosphate hydrolysis protein